VIADIADIGKPLSPQGDAEKSRRKTFTADERGSGKASLHSGRAERKVVQLIWRIREDRNPYC
jgi:hypothetical protein